MRIEIHIETEDEYPTRSVIQMLKKVKRMGYDMWWVITDD